MGRLRRNETVHDRVARVELACGHREIPTTFVAVDGDQPIGCASLIEHDMLTVRSFRHDLQGYLSRVTTADAASERLW
jgi:hypothetical protein